MDVRVASLILRFARPLPTAYGELHEREVLLLRLRGADGVVGWGEAAPLEPYDGVPLEAVREALAVYEPILRVGDDLPGGALLDACRDAADLPQALAAVDLALWDRAGNREGRPVSDLITDDPAASVRVNATIAAEDRAGAAAAAAAAARAGDAWG
jgi:L-alanine-DL-glutamate epimerase-like enolase superfamily enzyme